MENRRYGAAKASKPQMGKRSQQRNGEKPYEHKRSTLKYGSGPGSYGRKGKKKYQDSKSGKRFKSKKSFYPKNKGRKKPWKKEQLPRIVSDLQVTDGKHRGKYLAKSESPRSAPTERRLREVMFRILYRQVRARRFLDLCSGIGMVGIEAISRGALLATLVERSARMCSYIRKNLETCGINIGHGEIFEMEVVPFLKKMRKKGRYWDVVYFAPPYDTDYDDVLRHFETGACVRPGGVLVVEHHSEMFFPENLGVMKRWKVVVEGESAMSFYDRKS